ncbi:hypothetical protein AGMMS49942_22270 [Spirochaetia bacterium]|nr:hypothetical protein AGMMS49942_22270 [Spirochaetia bacterium]
MVPVRTYLKGKIMDFNFSNEAYQEFINQKKYVPSNARIRPDDMNIFEWMSIKHEEMSKTPEGQELIAAIQSIDD